MTSSVSQDARLLHHVGSGGHSQHDCGTRDIFRFLSDDHPLTAFLSSQRADIARALPRNVDGVVVANTDLKMSVATSEAWRPERLTCLMEPRDSPQGERLLWIWRAKTGVGSLHTFPNDPYLPDLADWIKTPVDHDSTPLTVTRDLRYVPTRRVTLSAQLARAPNRTVIVKFKRRSKLAEAALRLACVNAASLRSKSPVPTARMIGVLPKHAAFVQEYVPGEGFDRAIAGWNISSMMEEAGHVHARLHALDVADVGDWRLGEYQQVIGEDIRWITFMIPEIGRRLERLWQPIARRLEAANSMRHVFCHGDFVPGQLLCGGNGLAVTDFDLARRGVDLQEVAKWIASLKYHVPMLVNAVRTDPASATELLRAAERAYLAGYERQSGRTIDERDLNAFVAAAEIHYLAVWLRKDRFSARAFERALTRIEVAATS